MLDFLYEKLNATGSNVPSVIIAVALMLVCGFLLTRVTKLLKLPNVTAYILAGILMNVTKVVPQNVIDGMGFISDIALAFIAFSAGEYMDFALLKKSGGKLVILTLFESLLASVLVFVLAKFVLGLNTSLSVILCALASATAPASTLMTIRQTGAKGGFVNTLLSVVAFDNVVSLVAFSVAVSVATGMLGGSLDGSVVLLPVLYNLLLIAVGALLGLLLKLLMQRRSDDNRLIVTVALLFTLCGIGSALGTSSLLACMTMGTVYVNVAHDEKLFRQINYFSPPILLLFFVRSGLNFNFNALFDANPSVVAVPMLTISLTYFVVRIVGKYLGSFVGSAITKQAKETRQYLGLALIPQAGVAIGLAAVGARELARLGFADYGTALETVVMASSILYELVGPACAKLALTLSHSVGQTANTVDGEETGQPGEVLSLKQQLVQIQNELANKEYARSAEEEAFLEVADDSVNSYLRKKFINRR